eukprot:6948658-Pyramimonas_sp.AAC.3
MTNQGQKPGFFQLEIQTPGSVFLSLLVQFGVPGPCSRDDCPPAVCFRQVHTRTAVAGFKTLTRRFLTRSPAPAPARVRQFG